MTDTENSPIVDKINKSALAMVDKGYAYKLADSHSKAWSKPMLNSKTGFFNAPPYKNDPYFVEIDFSGNKHLVYKMILMKRGDGCCKDDRHINYIQIEYQVDGPTW